MSIRPRVLVVDDSPTTCLFIASTLEQAGYNVDVALKGYEALAKVMEFQPDCLILDVMLPDISGYAVCRQVQQSKLEHEVFIILISTKNAPLDQHYGLRQGAHRYLPKPFTAEVIAQAVWEGVPRSLRQAVRPSFYSRSQPSTPAVLDLIPRRIVDEDAMRTRNPFTHSPVIEEKQARQLYDAIDGKRTLFELANATGLETSEATRTLHTLLKQNCIQVYDSTGNLVESTT